MISTLCLVSGSSFALGAMLLDRRKRKAWLRDALGVPDQ